MISNIRSKLNDCLGERNYSQRDVVYILVQAFKLLEREERTGDFQVIRFYRNWASHAVLNGYRDVFNSVIARYQNGFGSLGNMDLACDEIRAAFRKFSPVSLKEELNRFIKIYLAPNLQNAHTLNWRVFREQLYEVIRDIPVEVKEGSQTIFIFECRELVGRIAFDDLMIYVGMSGVHFNFHVQDGTI
jgi:hypothetical protein